MARIHHIARRTVFDWLARYRTGGWDALKEGARRGRPREPSGENMQWVYDAVTMGSPRNHKFDFCLWTLSIIRSMIAKERGVELSKSAVSRLLGHLGLSPQPSDLQVLQARPEEDWEVSQGDVPRGCRACARAGRRDLLRGRGGRAQRCSPWLDLGETAQLAMTKRKSAESSPRSISCCSKA